MIGKKKLIAVLVIISLLIGLSRGVYKLIGQVEKKQIAQARNDEMEIKSKLNGNWKGMLEDGTDIHLIYSYKENKLLLSSSKGKYYNYEVREWEIEKDKIKILTEYRRSNIQYILKLEDASHLCGTYLKYDEEKEIILEKLDDKPIIRPFFSEEFGYQLEDKQLELKQFSIYETDQMDYHFNYNTHEKDRYEAFIDKYQLDKIAKDKRDIELMKALLMWVGNNCHHDGSVAMPDVYTPENIMKVSDKNRGINARGLSILLAELLRAYGIKARAVTCMPSSDLITECNVVVEAYSEEYNQWIMLDPSYHLILKNIKNEYVNLQMLRKAIRDNEILVPNHEANRNGEGFNLESYIYYMSKNVFRFSSAENLYYGAEECRDGNRCIELVPKMYETPRVVNDIIVITTDEEKFWEKP